MPNYLFGRIKGRLPPRNALFGYFLALMMADFCPVPNPDVHGDFLRKVVDLLFKNVVFTTRQDKVLLWKTPEELQQEFDFTLPQVGDGQDKLLQIMKNTVKFSVKTGHPYFINQLFSGWVSLHWCFLFLLQKCLSWEFLPTIPETKSLWKSGISLNNIRFRIDFSCLIPV